MGANSEKITIRLTPDQVENIDSIMLNRDIRSRSKVIRMAIENFISENLIDLTSQKQIIHLPNTVINRLEDCISSGDVLNIETAIQIAIDRYLAQISDYYLKQRIELRNARLDEQKKRASRLSANDALRR